LFANVSLSSGEPAAKAFVGSNATIVATDVATHIVSRIRCFRARRERRVE
jgi:hypothetical protein